MLRARIFRSVRFFASRRYTKDHEWIAIKDKVGTIGITEYAQKALGDVVYVELPKVGDKVSQSDQIGAVESVKAASDIYSPVSGTIVEVNKSLENEPSLLNTSTYRDGWIAKVLLDNDAQVASLMDDAAYEKHIKA